MNNESKYSNNTKQKTALRDSIESNWKVVILFSLLSWVWFVVFFFNIGPLTSTDPEMSIAGSYALATGQSFNAPDSEEGGLLLI